MDMDGLQDSVVRMLAGESVSINIGTFSNDMTTFATKDDILTLLVHLGYLTYDSISETAAIPNKEGFTGVCKCDQYNELAWSCRFRGVIQKIIRGIVGNGCGYCRLRN